MCLFLMASMTLKAPFQNELGIQTVRKTFSKDTPMKCHNHPNDIVTLTVTNGLAQVIKWSRSTYAVFR